MTEPSNQLEPEASEDKAGQPALPRTKTFDLDSNTAAFVCYIPVCPVNLVLCGIFIATEPKAHRYVRFHAMQSLVLGGAYFAFSILVYVLTLMMAILPFLNFLMGILNLLSLIVTLAYVGISIKLMIDAKKGRMEKLMFVGDVAEQFI